MSRVVAGLLLGAVLVTAGCISADQPLSPTEAGEGPESATDDGPGRSWPALEEARIRPGVPVAGGCTSSFLFQRSTNTTLYLSTAAHCVLPEKDVGDPVSIHGGAFQGTLAFTVRKEGDPSRDFALVALNNSYRDEIHPAVLHYGGPTGLATDVSRGDKVATFGNSPARNRAGELDPRSGIVEHHDSDRTRAYFFPHSIPGDSGSPVITADGGAVGTLTSGTVVVPSACAGCNGVANIGPSLEAAREAGLNVSLVTWPMLREPVIDRVPDPPLDGDATDSDG